MPALFTKDVVLEAQFGERRSVAEVDHPGPPAHLVRHTRRGLRIHVCHGHVRTSASQCSCDRGPDTASGASDERAFVLEHPSPLSIVDGPQRPTTRSAAARRFLGSNAGDQDEISAAVRRTVASRHLALRICRPTGRPSRPSPIGTLAAGRPARLAGSASAHHASKDSGTGLPPTVAGARRPSSKAVTGIAGVSRTSTSSKKFAQPIAYCSRAYWASRYCRAVIPVSY